MKNILTLALCLFAAVAFAADPDATMPIPNTPITVGSYSGTTAKIVAVSTNSYFTVGVSEQTELAMFINFKYLNAPGAGDVNRIDLQLYRGIDATKFETNVWQTLTFVAGSTTAANSSMTNITVAGIPYLRGRFINVSTNSHATNVLFQVRGKTGAVKIR